MAEPILFIDRSLGSHLVPDALRKAGATVEIHDDHFKPDSPDGEWLGEAGRMNWVVLTKDQKIRYRAMERDSLIQGRVRAFAVTAGHLGGPELAELVGVRSLEMEAGWHEELRKYR